MKTLCLWEARRSRGTWGVRPPLGWTACPIKWTVGWVRLRRTRLSVRAGKGLSVGT